MVDKKQYETNARAVNTLFGILSQSKFVKVMQLNPTKEIWDRIIQSYEVDTKVKSVELQTLRIQYETLRMHSDENISSFFLCVDEILNRMKNMGEYIKETTLVEKISRSLTPKLDSKLSTIEEK